MGGSGGKGGKGGGTSIPDFVKDATESLGNRSEQVWDLARPLNEQGTSQMAELIRTGGLNANVPIINNAVAAQRSAGRTATSGPEGAITTYKRGNIDAPFQKRQTTTMRKNMLSRANRIPYLAAAPVIGASISSAISGGRTSQAGLQGSAQALAAGTRRDIVSQNKTQAGARAMQGLLYGLGGGFSGMGGGAKGNSVFPGQWQVGGPTSYTGYGASAPGIMLEF